ncbi:MAG: hypothetical protein HC883_00520 [Bdellovibrionaceae bacterium]|nr:hypothetical protein [Pseudobdellovibrionaceae bacterium]
MKKTFRRFIRIGNKIEASPKFRRKSDADEWYEGMLKKKAFEKQGLEHAPQKEISVIEWSRIWMVAREASYPKSTTSPDDQRLRDYVLPKIGDRTLSSITSSDIRFLLEDISKEGFLKEGFKISPSTARG